MPSICLVYGFRVALGGFRGFRLQDTFARGRVSAHNENCCNLLALRCRLCKTMLMAHKLQRRQFLKLTALASALPFTRQVVVAAAAKAPGPAGAENGRAGG